MEFQEVLLEGVRIENGMTPALSTALSITKHKRVQVNSC